MRHRLLFTALLSIVLSPQSFAQMSYTGAGSCTSSNCHGSVWPKSGGKINQNEYTLWSTNDKHSKAYSVLLEPRSRLIARNLKIDRPETSSVCLDCHATNVPPDGRASSFDISDGVGCESCHGPASAWLGQHTTRDWNHDRSLGAGMVDTKAIQKRAELCLSCHLGTEKKTVGHELIAAGHPSLVFELETFSALMPTHWRKENEKTDSIQRWAAAQLIGLRESMSELQRESAKAADSWPDFAQFECSACHHVLTLPSSTQEHGFAGTPGLPAWNGARFIVARQLIGSLSPSMLKDLDTRVAELKKSLEHPFKDRQVTAVTAQNIAESMNQLLPLIGKTEMKEQFALTMMRHITGDAARIADAGMAAAEQATMSLDVLYSAFHPAREGPINTGIGHLYDLLQSRAGYNPAEFSAALRRIGDLL